MAAPREDGQTWASRIRAEQEAAQEGPGKPSLDSPAPAPGDEASRQSDQKQAAPEHGPAAGEKTHPNPDMSSHGENTEGPKNNWAASVLKSEQPKGDAYLGLGHGPQQEHAPAAGEKIHPNLDMSSYGENTQAPKNSWAASVLKSDPPKGDAYLGLGQQTQEEKAPGKWAQMAAAIGTVGGAAAGTAIQKGFTGTGEFVSRFFGLPEHSGHSPEQQAAPPQDHDHDRGMDR